MKSPGTPMSASSGFGRLLPAESVILNRRGFLRNAGLLIGGVSASRLDVARCANVVGNDTLRIGLIGCGGRGTGAAKEILNTGPGIQLVAMADIFEDRLRTSLSALQNTHRSQALVTRDRQFIGFDAYQKVIGSGVDAVILATPPGFRPGHFEMVANAGKHCFLEKPLAVDVPGIRRLLKANETAQHKRLSVVVGHQRRFLPGYQAVIGKIHEGTIGRISKLEAMWRQNSPIWTNKRADLDAKHGRRLSELEFQLMNWPSFGWLAGDLPLDSLSHNLDICNWIMQAAPQSVRASCARREGLSNAYGDASDFFRAEYIYPNGATMVAEAARQRGTQPKITEVAYGTTGTATCGTYSIADHAGMTLWRHDGNPNVNPLQLEQDQFVESIRSGKPLNMLNDAANTSLTCLMGRIAAVQGREVTWQEVLASSESLFPKEPLTWDTPPPTLPDKYGDYQFPARSRA